jgi:hypothetical protein
MSIVPHWLSECSWYLLFDCCPLQGAIELGPDFEPSCMAHPDTYINKVVLGGADGSLQLWNFKTQQLVHSFKGW